MASCNKNKASLVCVCVGGMKPKCPKIDEGNGQPVPSSCKHEKMIKHPSKMLADLLCTSKRDAYKHAPICQRLVLRMIRVHVCTIEGGYGFLCSLRLMFTSFLATCFALMPWPGYTGATTVGWCLMVLVPLFGNSFSSCFYVSFVIFCSFFSRSVFFTTEHSSISIAPTPCLSSRSHCSMCARSVASTRALILHILLENWVQHDLFTIHKYVLWLQHTTDMIIFLCFLPLCLFPLR